MSRTYVIYYGWLAEPNGEARDEAKRIADARVPLLIAPLKTAPPNPHVNLSPAVLDRLRAAGTEVFGYVDTAYGKVAAKVARREVAEAVAAGLDGVFFDQTPSSPTDAELAYYAEVSAPVKAAGKRIIANAGVAKLSDRTLRYADRIMLEHRWRDLALHSPWTREHPPETFMGVSSNEAHAMGYAVDEARAIADTRECWKQGIGWHASTEAYVRLPDWFERYLSAVKT